MKREAQGFEQFSLKNAYDAEEESFLKTTKIMPISEIPADESVVNSRVLYSIKHADDGTIKMKARISPHGNEDNLKDVLTKDCSKFPPTGLRIIDSIASFFNWKFFKSDVKSFFCRLQMQQEKYM